MSDQENEYSLQDKKFVAFFLRMISIITIITGIAIFIFSDRSKPLNNWGDYVGGIVGTLFSLVGIFLLFLTLWEQRRSFTKERFENRLFELIKLHRSNVDEFNIGDRVKGRKCFNQMVNEFRHIYKLTLVGKEDSAFKEEKLFKKDEDVVDFAFKIFFFGIGYSSERQLKNFITPAEIILFQQFIKPRLVDIQEAYSEFRKKNKEDFFEWCGSLLGEKDDWTFEINYYPFDGHTSRLAHYYRHLYHSVKYIVSYSSEFEYTDIYGYLKMLRGQMSNQEQLLLYYNSLCDFGKNWHKRKFFTDYCFLKNLPIELVEVKPHPHEKVGIVNKYGKKIFEWDEI